MSEVTQEFSRFAHEYDSFNIIQSQVAGALIGQLPDKHYPAIIDIGCGSGEVFKKLKSHLVTFDNFIALDASVKMLALHPEGKTITKTLASFDVTDAFDAMLPNQNAIILSSSALQWSKDLDLTLERLSQKAPTAHFSIFTSNTFKSLHQIAGVTSPIYSAEVLKCTIEKYYDATFETKEYKLYFNSVREMFTYIKKSGVSGGKKQLTYKQTKELIRSYSLSYLEFEVLFAKGNSLSSPFRKTEASF